MVTLNCVPEALLSEKTRLERKSRIKKRQWEKEKEKVGKRSWMASSNRQEHEKEEEEDNEWNKNKNAKQKEHGSTRNAELENLK